MKTLVLHPDDRTTDFLKTIYEGKGYTVVTDKNILRAESEVRKLIKAHDRIMMMGHGHPGGLFFTCINNRMVYLLREKQGVYIWCNADKFVEKYELQGFYTGMFISEVGEAYQNGIKTIQDEVTYSNVLFALELSKVIDEPNVHSLIKESYKGVFENDVIRFNNDRLYYRGLDDTDSQERELAERDLEEEMRDFTDDLSDDEQPDFGDDDDDIDPAGGHGLYSHI
jgi:hypothetical protein